MSTNKSSTTNENETSKLGHSSTSKLKPPSKIPSIIHDNTKKVDLETIKSLIEALEEDNLKAFILNFIQTNPKFKATFIESLPKTKKGTKTPQPQESKSQITSKQIKSPKPSSASNKPQSSSSTTTKPPTASTKPSNTSNKPQTSSSTSTKPPSSSISSSKSPTASTKPSNTSNKPQSSSTTSSKAPNSSTISTKPSSASNKPQSSLSTATKPPSSSISSSKSPTVSTKPSNTSNKLQTSSNKVSAPVKNQTSSTNKQPGSSASKPNQTTKKATQTANKGESTGATKKPTSTTGKTSTTAKTGTTKPTAKTSTGSKTSSKKSATSSTQKSGTKKSSSPSRPSSGHGNVAKRTAAQLKKTKSQIIHKPRSTEPINKTLPKLAPSKNDLILGKDGTFQRTFDLKLVEEVKQPMLLHIKGKRKVKTSQVRCSWKSLNYGDCFILDANEVIYIWNGPQSNRMEKAKAIDVAQRIKDKERHSNASIVEVFGNDPTTASPEQLPFWKLLGALNYVPAPSKNSKTPTNFAGLDITSAEKGGSDEVTDKQELVEEFTIISVEEGEIKIHTTLAPPKLEKGMLNSQICCVVDCGKEFYLWQGRKSTLQQRAKALEYANHLFSKEKRGDWVQLSKLMEGTEPIIFQEKFADWGTLPIAVAAPPVHFRPKAELPIFDIRILLEPVSIPPPVIFGDGPGQICNIWRIHEHTKEQIKPEAFGQFYSAESFLILYKYPVKNREETVIYFWQGRNSTINDKGTSAYLTVELDSEEAHGEAKQIRVVQTQEPSHFLKALNGQIIIHKGKEEDHFSKQTIFVYQVHEGEYGIHVTEMDNHIRSFNSNDCYIVQIWLNDNRELQVIAWFGQGSSSCCREECQKIATKYFLAPITSITVETEEDEEVEEEEEEENQDENAIPENQNEEHIENQEVETIEKEEESQNENKEDHNEKPNEESNIAEENIDQGENNDTQNEESNIEHQEVETIEKEEEPQNENEEDHNEKPNQESTIKVENIDCQEENQNEGENVDNEEKNIANQNEENIDQEEHQNKAETIENEEENFQNEERTIEDQNDEGNIQNEESIDQEEHQNEENLDQEEPQNEENLDQEEHQNEIQTQDKVDGQEIKTIEKEPNILEKEIDSKPKLEEQIETKKENEIKPEVKAKRENKSKDENKKNEPKSKNTKPEDKFTILDIQVMNEGEEKEIFWKFIEKGEYCKNIHKRKPRLFQASNSSGRFYVDSLIYFSQADLVDEDMFFLDTENYLFVWEGAYATVEEKKCSLATALEYLKLIKEKENNPQKQGYYILSGKEPLEFTSCFFGWQWQKPTSFLAHFQKIQPPVNPPSLSTCPTIQEVYREYTRTYTLAELQLKPPQLDPSKYESYLCDEEFQKLFQCSKDEFATLPSWKQKDKKKAVGLF